MPWRRTSYEPPSRNGNSMRKQSRVLNDRRKDHPISPATIRKWLKAVGSATSTRCSFYAGWGSRPRHIAAPQPRTGGVPLAVPDDVPRLRWNLHKLYDTLNAARADCGATWRQAADRLRCTPSQLTALRHSECTEVWVFPRVGAHELCAHPSPSISAFSVATVEASASPSTFSGRKWRWNAARTCRVWRSYTPVISTP